MEPTYVTIAVEGDADAAVARRLLQHLELEAAGVYGLQGKGDLDEHLAGYNRAARHAPWLVIRDLDRDAECPAALLATLLPQPAARMCCRVAVRAIESWLLADRERIGDFLGVAKNKIPTDPDTLDNPKLALVNLARHARRKRLRVDLVPAQGTTARVGPAYTSRIVEFASRSWRPDTARQHSDSLQRCLAALQRFSTKTFRQA